MKKLLILIFVLFLVGCRQALMESTTEEEVISGSFEEEMQKDVLINLHDGTFDKISVTIKKGTKVTWRNLDDKPYWFTVYIYTGDERSKEIARYPSGPLRLNDEFSLIFEQVGEHDVKGQEYGGLRGKVIVTE